MKKSMLLLLCILPLVGCATVLGDDKDLITIRSTQPDAKLFVNGNEVGTGSASYTLPRDKTAIITATKHGCSDVSVPTTRRIVGATFLNVLFWPGFIVDAATGRLNKTYPTDYTVTPNCSSQPL